MPKADRVADLVNRVPFRTKRTEHDLLPPASPADGGRATVAGHEHDIVFVICVARVALDESERRFFLPVSYRTGNSLRVRQVCVYLVRHEVIFPTVLHALYR